ncbi:MAG: carbohydrate kinase [Gemmataceae bacterium]|nr:carbohydrate kinase [Gemmataceae bacterium]
MLTTAIVEHILATIPQRTIGVLGDLFLDRYLDLDAAITEPSIETGLDAYQVSRVRSCPGAAGTVINNLAALGVGRIVPIGMIGDDGEGHELRQALAKMSAVDMSNLAITSERRTPTYTKPMLCEPGKAPRELNRLDIKNRLALPAAVENMLTERLAAAWSALDVLLVLDQVSEPECGVVTARVRAQLAILGETEPKKVVIVDSRERIGLFRNAWLKPNERECLRAAGKTDDLRGALGKLMAAANRPIICTRGDKGMLIALMGSAEPIEVHAYRVTAPIDTVGAGDSSSAALACALASGAELSAAAAFGNLVASITIQQIGTTGTAAPDQVRRRWHEATDPRLAPAE